MIYLCIFQLDSLKEQKLVFLSGLLVLVFCEQKKTSIRSGDDSKHMLPHNQKCFWSKYVFQMYKRETSLYFSCSLFSLSYVHRTLSFGWS